MLKINKYFFICSIFFLFGACKNETLDPIYKPVDIEFHDLNIEIPTSLDMTIIQPDAVRSAIQTLTGWVPVIGSIVGDFVQLPIDLTLAIFPPLSSSTNSQLPPNSDWSNPDFLKTVASIKLTDGKFRITPVSERGPDYKPEMCWGVFVCPDVEFSDFLDEVSIYLSYKDPKPGDQEVLLGHVADVKNSYDKVTKILPLDKEDAPVDLRPYMEQYNRFQVKIIAKGKPPAHKVYMDGSFKINLVLKIK